MAVRQLKGTVDVEAGPDDRDLIIQGLKGQLAEAQAAAAAERNKAARIEGGARGLRKLLDPFHDWLGAVYGEFDAMGVASAETDEVSALPRAQGSRWEQIKQMHSPQIGKAIDVLLAHGTMNMSQLAAALRISRGNCSGNLLPKLRSLGLIVGAKEFTLKQL